jgi:hypothetical protein
MKYFNLDFALLGQSQFLKASNAQIGVWLKLVSYCAAQENGGMITACDIWQDREWLIACGVTRSEVHQDSPLWIIDPHNGTLDLMHYPREMERKVQAMRKAGKKGAKRRWNTEEKMGGPLASPLGSPIASLIAKDKVKESNSKNGNGFHARGDEQSPFNDNDDDPFNDQETFAP